MGDRTPLFQARIYGEQAGDYQLVNRWYEARHSKPLSETILPPCGVIIEMDGEPVAALWCYEVFGIGIAFLEHAVTRSGLSISEAKRALSLAAEACIRIAKTHASENGGDVSLFYLHARPEIARFLPALGFQTMTENNIQGFSLRRD